MANDLISFTSEEFGGLQILWRDDKPWFFATEIGRLLKLRNVRGNVARLLPTEAAVTNRYTRSATGVEQRREVQIVSESGLYKLIFASRTPAAERFQTWVTSEVLPALRRDGAYRMPAPRQRTPEQIAAFMARPAWERSKYIAYLGNRRFGSYEAWRRAVDKGEF